ncbi:MAG: hypothetical protein JXR51_11180, partial [Bacteroidales bacterium]|nr:hypothetical protein [Bacteroidales bacterium]
MNNNISDEKNNDLKLSKVDILYHLLNNSKIYYLQKSFDRNDFIQKLTLILKDDLKYEVSHKSTENIDLISYSTSKKIKSKLGLDIKFVFFFIIDNGKLYYDFKAEDWFKNKEIKSTSIIKKFLNETNDELIENKISLLLIENEKDNEQIISNNIYIDEISFKEKLWFYSQVDIEENLLAFLHFSETKKLEIKTEKDVNWKFILTQKNCFVAGFNKNDELVSKIDLSDKDINVKSEIGRLPFSFSNSVFYSTKTNGNLFLDIKHLNKLSDYERIREISRLNWLKSKKDQKTKEFAYLLIKDLIKNSNNPFDELSLLYMDFTENEDVKFIDDFIKEEKLTKVLDDILNFDDTDKLLSVWAEKWELEYIDLIAINKLLLESIKNSVQANNILEFHKLVRKHFLKKSKDKINETVFDIEYAKHHIKCGLLNDAKKILNKRLSQLPDESISDILPANDTDLTGSSSGQILKITIFELLSELEPEKVAIEHKRQIAVLQPLVLERIQSLIEISNPELSEKAKALKILLQANGISKNEETDKNFKYNILKENIILENLKHPASRKGGSFSNIQKWLAGVKVPDYSMVKSYSEKLSAQKHPELNEIVTDIKYALNIENLEVYISRGDKSTGISGFEGSPMFLVVGSEHIDKNSAHYLNFNELKFAVAIEIAHLYFKHSRITSSDIWKGAFEKGYWVFDTV